MVHLNNYNLFEKTLQFFCASRGKSCSHTRISYDIVLSYDFKTVHFIQNVL